MPVVPAVVPPLSSFRNSSSRPTMEARRGGCAVREGREPRARIAYRTRAGIARATWRGYRSVAGRCRAARPKGRSAGRPECRPAPGWWGAPAPTTHASASGLRPGAARATWWAGRRAWARSYRASGTMSGGALRAGIGRRGRGATTRAPSALTSRSPGGTSGGSPTGAAQGSGNAPDGGLTAAVTGPSRRCRCCNEPLWGVTKAPGYAGGSLLRAHLELGAGFQDPEFRRDAYSCCERANPSGFANATGAFIRRDAHDIRSQKECKRLRLPSKRPVLSQRCRWVVT